MPNLSVYLKVMLTINANSFLYFLGKLPIINRLITPNLYKDTRLKLIFSFFGTIFDFLKTALVQSVLVFVFIRYLPQLLSGNNLSDSPALGVETSLFILLFCVLPVFLQSTIFRGSKEDYIFLNHFSLDPDEYYRVKTGTGLIRQFISLLPVLLFLLNDYFTSFMLLGVKLACTMMGNVYFLKQYKDKRKLSDVKIRWLVFLAAAVFIYVGVYFDRVPSLYPSYLVAIAVFLISLIIVALGWCYVTIYQNFKEVAVQFASKDVLTLRVSVTTTLNEDDTGLKAFDWAVNKQFWEKNKNEKPENYIENTFNHRFSKPIWSFTKRTILQNLILFISAGLLSRTGVINLDETNLVVYSPILISLAMSMTYGRYYLQLCFRNLDLPLLYHHLYSRNKIVQSMQKRLLFLIRNGMLLLLSFAASLYLFLRIAEIQISPNIFLRHMVVCILVFLIYELYQVLVYYALQPYSTELTVRNPLFTIIGIGESLFSVYFLFARADILTLTYPLLIIAAGLLICFLLLTKYVDKTYKLRY